MPSSRRVFLQSTITAGLLPVVMKPAVVEVSNRMKLSSPPGKLIACWSGWRTGVDNHRITGWYTAHLPFFANHPESRYSAQHFVSVVQSPRAVFSACVSGYYPGDHFNTANSILLEENEEVMAAWQLPELDLVLNRVFVGAKQRALDELTSYLHQCVRVD